MSKKFKDKTCVYCFINKSTTEDHVISRKFFHESLRTITLPSVPSCSNCNSKKSQLEQYLTALLPFGSIGPSGLIAREEKTKSRLENNQKLHKNLSEGVLINDGGEMTLPVDDKKLLALFQYITRGLIWYHWKVILELEFGVKVFLPTAVTESLLPKWTIKINENLGDGTFCCQASQGTDYPQFSFWRFSVLNGIIFRDDESQASSIVAITAKNKFLDLSSMKNF